MHVDDIGAERDVDRCRSAEFVSGRENTLLAELEFRIEDFAADDFAEALAFRRGDLRGAIEKSAGFLGHPEDSFSEPRANIFRGPSRIGEFEVVDDSGAVGCDRADDSVAQQAADDRTQSDFDRMRAAHQQERALGCDCAFAMARASSRSCAAPSTSGSDSRKSRKLAPARDFGREAIAANEARECGEVARAGAARIKRSQFHQRPMD